MGAPFRGEARGRIQEPLEPSSAASVAGSQPPLLRLRSAYRRRPCTLGVTRSSRFRGPGSALGNDGWRLVRLAGILPPPPHHGPLGIRPGLGKMWSEGGVKTGSGPKSSGAITEHRSIQQRIPDPIPPARTIFPSPSDRGTFFPGGAGRNAEKPTPGNRSMPSVTAEGRVDGGAIPPVARPIAERTARMAVPGIFRA